MGLLKEPTHPYQPNTASPYSAELEAARKLFDAQIDDQTGWEPVGDKDDVHMEKKTLGGQGEASGIPLVRGTCTIENATTDQIVPIIQSPGIRKKWDPRFDTAWILRRFSASSYEFYSLGNSPPGMSWIINPRDLSGIHQSYVGGNKDGGLGENKEVILIQSGVVDNERAPEQRGRTRMKLTLSGWRLTPQGQDVRITYLCKVHLGGAIPEKMVATVIQDLPVCAGKVRNTYYEYGYPPYLVTSESAGEPQVIQQTEFFHFGSSKNGEHVPLKNDKHWHLHFTGKAGARFEIKYDHTRMYAQEGGVHHVIKGDGKDGVTAVDDANGTISIQLGQNADGKNIEFIIQPHTGSAKQRR